MTFPMRLIHCTIKLKNHNAFLNQPFFFICLLRASLNGCFDEEKIVLSSEVSAFKNPDSVYSDRYLKH